MSTANEYIHEILKIDIQHYFYLMNEWMLSFEDVTYKGKIFISCS